MFARFHALATLRLLGIRYQGARSKVETTQGIIDSARIALAASFLSRSR